MLPKSNNRNSVRAGILGSALALSAIAAPSFGAGFAAVGPAEVLDCKNRSVKVLGVTFRANDDIAVQSICSSGRPDELIYVAVSGESVGSEVQLHHFAVLSKGAYVPGASPVYLRGVITNVSNYTGDVDVNGATLVGAQKSLLVGSALEIVGTQPHLGGVVLVETLVDGASAIQSVVKASSSGSGKLSSSGSGVFSSAGSGKLSSSGSGVLSSSGSGKLSSSGSGVLSSSGSGKLSSSGSGLLGSSDSGTLSSPTSGKLSSSGSGILSSSGSGKLSSSGSGALSSSGSGKLSSSGSGASSSLLAQKLSSSGSGKLSSSGSGTAQE